MRFQQGGRLRSGTLNSSSGHGAGSTGLDPCQLGNRGLRTASHGGAGNNLLGIQAGGCPQQSGQGSLGRQVGCGRVGEASAAQELPCPTGEMVRELCGLLFLLNHPIY